MVIAVKVLPVAMVIFLLPCIGRTADIDPVQSSKHEKRANRPFGFVRDEVVWQHKRGEPVKIEMCWEDPLPREVLKSQKVRQYRELVQDVVLRTWSMAVAVDFLNWQQCSDPDLLSVHISVADDTDGPHSEELGKLLIGRPRGVVLDFDFINFNPREGWCAENEEHRKECIQAIAVHEFGHVLGLAHENNRDDIPDNLSECDIRDNARSKDQQGGTRTFGPWDAKSVMNYCHRIYKEGGYDLSATDLSTILDLYPRRVL